jgi:DNA repair protein RadA/Sms
MGQGVTRASSKPRTVFSCAECGQSSPKWLGQCPTCRKWNTVQEEVVTPEPKGATPRGWEPVGGAGPMPLHEVEAD